MNLFQELRQRRVPQIASGYLVACWGAIQFLEFLEGRMTVSPNLVNLIGIGLLLFLPSVVMLAWVHGRPGPDTWGRIPKILLSANVLALVFLLFFMFRGQDLGAITKTIEVEDENGTVSEREIPKSEFRRPILIFYPENIGDQEHDWARETINILVELDLDQDVFVDVALPMSLVGALQDVGSADGHGLTRPLQRKVANDTHIPYFLTSTINFSENVWSFTSELHKSETGRVLANRTIETGDIYSLIDQISRQIREDLGIPSAHLENNPDLPIKELASSDLEAVKNYVMGLVAITHENDWAKAGPILDKAVEQDTGFAMAQFMRFAVYQTLGDAEKSNEAIQIAMDNLYRLPERTSFMIKSQYYYNVKQDADKSLAVVKMWSKLYPNDVDAFAMQGLFYVVRQDLPNAILAYKEVLAIDPSRVKMLRQIGDLYQQMGEMKEAEEHYLRYLELFPTDIKGYRDVADFYSATGQLSLARETLEKAQLIDPGELDLVLGLVDVDIKVGNFQESVQVLDAELSRAKTGRDRIKILTRQIALSRLLGKSDQLILDLDSYHTTLLEIQNPMQAHLVYSVLSAYISMAGRSEAALQRLDVLVTQVNPPYDKLVDLGRAWALVNMGRNEEAKEALANATEVVEAFKFETFRANLAFVGGMVAENEGDFSSAISLYTKTLETTMEMDPIFRTKLASALRKNSQSDEALKVLEAALKLDPAYPEIHLEMAEVYKDLGKPEKAREHLNRAQSAWGDAHPSFPPALQAEALMAQIN